MEEAYQAMIAEEGEPERGYRATSSEAGSLDFDPADRKPRDHVFEAQKARRRKCLQWSCAALIFLLLAFATFLFAGVPVIIQSSADGLTLDLGIVNMTQPIGSTIRLTATTEVSFGQTVPCRVEVGRAKLRFHVFNDGISDRSGGDSGGGGGSGGQGKWASIGLLHAPAYAIPGGASKAAVSFDEALLEVRALSHSFGAKKALARQFYSCASYFDGLQ